MKENRFDAVLVHGYWLSQGKDKLGRDRPVIPSLRARLGVRAAVLMYQEGLVKNIVLAGGHIWGGDYPSSAELMAKDAVGRYHVPAESVFIGGDAISTDEEVKIIENKQVK